MRIVREIRNKKANWELLRLTTPEGLVGYHTGDCLRQRDIDNNHYEVDFYVRHHRMRLEFVANIVFDAVLEPRAGRFYDQDTGLHYWANDSRAFEICASAIKGERGLRIENGRIVGRFTFANHGGKINLEPCPEPDAPVNAPDLSDFVRDLGKDTGEGAACQGGTVGEGKKPGKRAKAKT